MSDNTDIDDTDIDDTDITDNDTQFGASVRRKQERADALLANGQDPEDEPEGAGVDPRPHAGGKASAGAPPDADRASAADREGPESFPASDPPANY